MVLFIYIYKEKEMASSQKWTELTSAFGAHYTKLNIYFYFSIRTHIFISFWKIGRNFIVIIFPFLYQNFS